MKQECPTYLKTIRKSKALAATLSDTELEDDSDNEDDGILKARPLLLLWLIFVSKIYKFNLF